MVFENRELIQTPLAMGCVWYHLLGWYWYQVEYTQVRKSQDIQIYAKIYKYLQKYTNLYKNTDFHNKTQFFELDSSK